jgi:hypothetical protein
MVPSVLRVTSAAPARFRRIGGRILPVALCALALTVPVTRARATDLRRVLTDYTLESWSQKDGLPDASVYVRAHRPARIGSTACASPPGAR